MTSEMVTAIDFGIISGTVLFLATVGEVSARVF